MTPLAVALVALVAVGTPAHADVWREAIDATANTAFRGELQAGDDHVLLAHASMVSPNERKRHVDEAIAAYRRAALARPASAEPHYRIAATLDAFLVCSKDRAGRPMEREILDLCSPATFRTVGPLLIAELELAEQLAPLDPRFTVTAGDSTLFDRAILRTKLSGVVPRADAVKMLEAAARDYERIVQRSDEAASETVFANLAETYMMLGRIDEAVAQYDRAMAGGAGGSTIYGLAVALDRNGQTMRATQALVGLTDDAFHQFELDVVTQRTFYVPSGEVYYYYGLLQEHLGHPDKALEWFKKFIKSGAHPQYQDAAMRHVAALTKELVAHPVVAQPPRYPEAW
ncbi:MAG: tetratricopeptide repeat protein [Proteobacteria bacterium]|nr:tetratricopeptide repeat protein [Pseudomonadota bacterium]